MQSSIVSGQRRATYGAKRCSSLAAAALATAVSGAALLMLSPAGASTPAAFAKVGARLATSSKVGHSVSVNYLIEVSAWIPQQWVVDALNPGAKEPCNSTGCTQNGPQNPLMSSCGSHSTGSEWESVFAGDNHNAFVGGVNSGRDRGEVWSSFTYNGSTFTNVGQEVVLGTTHRYLKYSGGSSDCVEAKQASDSGGVAINNSGNELRMTIDTANPLVPGAPDIHAVVYITGQSNGTLVFNYQTTFFPSIAISVTRGSVHDVDIVNDADCLNQADVLGAGGAADIALGLANFNNTGTLTVDVDSGSGTIDHPDWLLC
jgi:hypothetical protein